jgi:hypothetical protein
MQTKRGVSAQMHWHAKYRQEFAREDSFWWRKLARMFQQESVMKLRANQIQVRIRSACISPALQKPNSVVVKMNFNSPAGFNRKIAA